MTQETIYITGAGSGIGQEVARRYAKMGANLALFDLRFDHSSRLNIEENRLNDQQPIEYYDVDVTHYQTLQDQLSAAETEIGLPDVVLHCAGIQSAAPFGEVSQQDFERVISVNLFGTRNVAKSCLPLLKKHVNNGKNKPKLVLVASMAGFVGTYAYTAYTASKFAVVGFAQSLRMEMKPEGIGVQVVCPPEVDTPMVHEEHKTIHPATLKLKLMAGTLTLEVAVDDIMRGLSQNRFYIIPGRKARFTFWLNKLLPIWLVNGVADLIIKKALSR